MHVIMEGRRGIVAPALETSVSFRGCRYVVGGSPSWSGDGGGSGISLTPIPKGARWAPGMVLVGVDPELYGRAVRALDRAHRSYWRRRDGK